MRVTVVMECTVTDVRVVEGANGTPVVRVPCRPAPGGELLLEAVVPHEKRAKAKRPRADLKGERERKKREKAGTPQLPIPK